MPVFSEKSKSILLTFDVEDWFQVENFKKYIEFSTWNSFDLRVEHNTMKILDFLDSFHFRPKATFFVLGWISEKLPGLIREIVQRGHEVASHGYYHHLCTKLHTKELMQDLIASRELLENITGTPVNGFRAPSFAVDNDVLRLIRQAGYLYDSSYNSFSAHGRYGTVDLSAAKKTGLTYAVRDDFFEIPVSNITINGSILPLGGGGYFRLFPVSFFRQAMKSAIQKDDAFLFYAHPWEFDPDQPRVENASVPFKFRHYVNLHKTEDKLRRLIRSFSDHRFITCTEYIHGTNHVPASK